MSDLARRRSARDLWISRSHLWAAGTAAALLAAISFSLGVAVSSGDDAHAADARPADAWAVPPAPDDSLVELLARVEASADPSGGVTALTFPDVLEGQATGAPIPEAPEPLRGTASAAPAPAVAPPPADPAPAGAFTCVVLRTPLRARALAVRDQLRARDLPAWMGAELVDGDLAWRVSLGGYPDAASAEDALRAYQARAHDLPVVAGGEVEPI